MTFSETWIIYRISLITFFKYITIYLKLVPWIGIDQSIIDFDRVYNDIDTLNKYLTY